ncbi:MAG: response regulator [Campylobacterota bacterium]|nr:response regulator [Campylobacterota bacterium]
MLDTEFLKTITILFAEDDVEIRDNLKILLEKKFKKIILAEDGIEALNIYKESLNNNSETIDIIISDINMPNMTGIELLDSVRKLNKDIPFVITTGYANNDNLLKAIDFEVTSLSIKPINIKKLITKLENISQNIYDHRFAIHNQKEAEEYLSIIDKVAIVSKANEKGAITYVNDIFCDIAGYTREELIGKNHNIVRHPDMLASSFKELWNTIKIGNEWSGKVKNKAKNGEAYYINATIFPLFNDTDTKIKGYMGIRFLTTEDENKKREFKSQVRELVIKHKEDINKLKAQQDNSSKFKFNDFTLLEDKLKKSKQKSSLLVDQLNHYEEIIKNSDKRNKDNISKANNKIKQYHSAVKHYMEKEKQVENKRKSLKKEIGTLLVEVDDKTKECARQAKVIVELRDVIDHQDELLAKGNKI